MTSSYITTGLDHPVIGVADMEQARAAYERLGFTVPPRGSHVEWGTGNWCIMFERDYIELRGVIKPGETHNLGEFLNSYGEGLMGVALGTSDAEATRRGLAARGLHPTPVKPLARNFELPDGWVQPRFSLCFLDQSEAYGLMFVVFCQHLTPELIRRPQWLIHKNGACGVASLTGYVADLDRAEATHRALFGESAVRRDDQIVAVTLGGRESLRFTTREGVERQFPGAKPPAPGQDAALAVLSLQVRDLAATEQCLARRGVAWRRIGAAVQVSPAEACGAAIEFIE